MATVFSFMDSPLVNWVRTFSEDHEPLDFQELCDGVFLTDVMAQIDHRELEIDNEIKRVPKDNNAKIHNWSVLTRSLHTYYQDVLQQLVVMETPDIVTMVKEPMKEASLSTMERVLLLLLGCAVQSDHKEDYINNIKSLDIKTQQAIVHYIQEITDNCDNVISMDLEDSGSGLLDKQLFRIIRNVIHEKSNLAQNLQTITQERDYYKQELVDKYGRPLTPPVHLERYQLAKELNHWKNKSNGLIEEIEEKNKLLSEQQDDLDLIKEQYLKSKSENLVLGKDARAVQSYRDELDILREKTVNLEKTEKDLSRYKERLGELDFYKSRVEELRKDNDSLVDSRSHLDQQLSVNQKKLDTVMDELVRCQVNIEEEAIEKERINKKLQEALDENSVLEFEKSKISEGYGSSGIRRILSISSMDLNSQQHLGSTLNDELSETMISQVTRLECEKDELTHELEDTKHRLSKVRLMLQKVQNDTEFELKRKTTELEMHTRKLRSQNNKNLTEEYHQKLEEIEQRSIELKRKMSEEFKERLSQLDHEKRELRSREGEYRKKLDFIQETWKRDRDQSVALKQHNQELLQEKGQFRDQIVQIQENSSQKIEDLEQQIRDVKEDSIRNDSVRICHLCDRDVRYDDSKFNSLCDPERFPLCASVRVDSPDVAELVSKGVQTSPPPAWISYSGDDVRLTETNNNKPAKSKSGSKKFLDILRPKSSRQGSPAPNSRPATVLGIVHEHKSTPRGVVTPQRRLTSTPDFSDGAFRRGDRMRATIQHGGSFREPHSRATRPVSDYMPFSRSDRLRTTMPEKRTVYVTPERRQHLTPSGSRSSISSVESSKSARFDYDGFVKPLELDSKRTSERLDSDKDSGCPTSPDGTLSPSSITHNSIRDSHYMTSVNVVNTEKIKTEIRTFNLPKVGEKWKVLVNKIVELQDKNQMLNSVNADLRKSLNSVKFSNERMELLEKRNLDLEVENRKLMKIVETLQASLSGGNPYDKRTYHFYSNV